MPSAQGRTLRAAGCLAAGTPIWALFNLDRQILFDSIAAGENNNRWRGIRTWPDGSTWVIQVHHMISTVSTEDPAEAGTVIAIGAGISVGAYEHSHFVFGIIEPGADEDELILLDPWILFRQMYLDRENTGRGD